MCVEKQLLASLSLADNCTATTAKSSCVGQLHFVLMTCVLRQVSENRLIGLLEQVNEQSSSKTKVTIQRRRALDDDY